MEGGYTIVKPWSDSNKRVLKPFEKWPRCGGGWMNPPIDQLYVHGWTEKSKQILREHISLSIFHFGLCCSQRSFYNIRKKIQFEIMSLLPFYITHSTINLFCCFIFNIPRPRLPFQFTFIGNLCDNCSVSLYTPSKWMASLQIAGNFTSNCWKLSTIRKVGKKFLRFVSQNHFYLLLHRKRLIEGISIFTTVLPKLHSPKYVYWFCILD